MSVALLVLPSRCLWDSPGGEARWAVEPKDSVTGARAEGIAET